MKFVADYFNAEKFESLFFIAAGVLAIVAGVYCWFVIKEPLYKGLAIPLIVVALIQITVGSSVYFRSAKDIARVESMFTNAPAKIQQEEIPRMKVVMKNFVIYRYVEIGLVVAGLLSFFLFPAQSFWRGVGIGLVIQAGLMLTLDYFAEKRGAEYLQQLVGLVR